MQLHCKTQIQMVEFQKSLKRLMLHVFSPLELVLVWKSFKKLTSDFKEIAIYFSTLEWDNVQATDVCNDELNFFSSSAQSFMSLTVEARVPLKQLCCSDHKYVCKKFLFCTRM